MAPSMSHTMNSRAIKIPLHSNTDSARYSESGRRRRSTLLRVTKHDHGTASDHKASPSTPDAWSSVNHQTDTRSQFQLRETAVASPSNAPGMSTPPTKFQRKDKQRASVEESAPPNNIASIYQNADSPLGPSMLSSSSYKSINLNSRLSGGDSDEPARLITYTKHSQGFTWNDELFLPSYLMGRYKHSGRYGGRRYRPDEDDMMDDDDGIGDFNEEGEKCPVTDIFVTDEEAAAMMP